jgi:TnpA family transposase
MIHVVMVRLLGGAACACTAPGCGNRRCRALHGTRRFRRRNLVACWRKATCSCRRLGPSHFGAFDRSTFTEWHARYGGRRVLVYWHVEEGTTAIHSQVLNSASEVAAMIDGVMRHDTSMNIDGNYVDSHGQSEIGFAITRLLGLKLLARIKQINRVKLYGPDPGSKELYPLLAPAMTSPIRWALIEQNYDMLVECATAIRVGTASTEAILRRFTHNASDPVYQAMLELGRAQKTIFVARYLRDRDLQREINSGLNIVEGWHDVIFFGKKGALASNRRDQQELTSSPSTSSKPPSSTSTP